MGNTLSNTINGNSLISMMGFPGSLCRDSPPTIIGFPELPISRCCERVLVEGISKATGIPQSQLRNSLHAKWDFPIMRDSLPGVEHP